MNLTRKEPETPSLDKIQEVKEQSQAIGEFLEWLRYEKGIVLAEGKKASWTCETCGEVSKEQVNFVSWYSNDDALWRHQAKFCKKVQDIIRENRSILIRENRSIPIGDVVEYSKAGLYLAPTSTDSLLHEFFGIDPNEVEKERRALLDFIRSKQPKR